MATQRQIYTHKGTHVTMYCATISAFSQTMVELDTHASTMASLGKINKYCCCMILNHAIHVEIHTHAVIFTII